MKFALIDWLFLAAFFANITAGTWHHIQVEPGTQVLVIEDSDTSKANTERKPI